MYASNQHMNMKLVIEMRESLRLDVVRVFF
jgi:hypothetical protein